MIVFPLIYRGSFIQGDEEEARQVESLILAADTCLVDAALSLNAFGRALARTGERFDRSAWNEDRRVEQEVRDAVARRMNIDVFETYSNVDAQINIGLEALKRKLEIKGYVSGYSHREPFLHARSVIFAVATIRRIVWRISKCEVGGVAANMSVAELDEKIADLKHVRDSATHLEDRATGQRLVRGRHEQIIPGPINSAAIHAPGGVMVMDTLEGDEFCCTLNDGRYGRFPVRSETVAIAQKAIQRILDSLTYRMEHVHVSPRV